MLKSIKEGSVMSINSFTIYRVKKLELTMCGSLIYESKEELEEVITAVVNAIPRVS